MLYTIQNLVKRRHREQGYCLHIRHLSIRVGARIAITGPSGCGKSTTLDILGLALHPDTADRFHFLPSKDSVDIMKLWQHGRHDDMAALRLKHMGYVLQTGELLPFLTVIDNMTLTARMAGIDPLEARDTATTLAESLNVTHLLSAMPATLSVGERQRVAIVRALTPRPQIVLADEPTAALDPYHAACVMEAFLNAIEIQGGTLILVTHNADWARHGGLEQRNFLLETGAEGVTAVLDDSNGLPSSTHDAGEHLSC